MANSYLVMISYILETSKSKPDRKLSFIMKNLKSKFHNPKFFKNGHSHSKSAVFGTFRYFSPSSLVLTYDMLYTAESGILRGI